MSVGADNVDFVRLNWVKDEIDAALRQAGQSLEAYVETPDDATLLRACSNHLHQVSGALRILELSGPGILALEMELIAGALARGVIKDRDAAIDALTRSILQLPDQLERLQSGQRDVPLALLPSINELRTLRGEKSLDEFALFHPDLSSVFIPVRRAEEQAAPAGAQELAQRLRAVYQRSLVAFYREPESLEELRRLGAVLSRLSGAAQRYSVIQLFWVGSGLVQTVAERSLRDLNRGKQLLGQLDREIKRLAEQGEAVLAEAPPIRLVREILYHLVRSRSVAENVREICETFHLDDLFPRAVESNRPIGPNLDLLNTVSQALKEDLARAKDKLDIFVAAESDDPSELEPLEDGLGKIADVLAMVGLQSSQEAVEAQVVRVREMVAGSVPCDEGQLMDLAGVLLRVENTLDELARGHIATDRDHADAGSAADAQLDAALVGVVREAINDMTQVEDAIVAYVADPVQKRVLEAVPRYVHRVSGSLRMLGHEEAARVALRVNDYVIEALLNSEAVPPRATLDKLADAITGLEYFVESTRERRPEPEKMLAMAAERLAELGFPVQAEAQPEDRAQAASLSGMLAETQVRGEPAQPAEPPIEVPEEAPAAWAETEMAEPPPAQEEAPAQAGEPEAAHEAAPTPVPESEPEPLPEPEPPPAVVGEAELAETQPAGTAAESPPVAEPEPVAQTQAPEAADEAAAKPPPADAAMPALAPDADPETVEIFIEEAEEIHEALGESYGRWRADRQDQEALVELRRSFHTLKGSGRLVGAQLMGEYAWAIENMLNRVIDGTVAASNAVVDLMDQAVEALPGLIAQLRGEGRPDVDIAMILEGAEFLALRPGRQERALERRAADKAPAGGPEKGAAQAPAEPAGEVEAMDPVLYEIFSQETEVHLATIREFLDHCHAASGVCEVNDSLLRALHTLHGSARMAGVRSIAELTGALERFAKLLHKNHGPFTHETLPVLEEALALIRKIFAHLNDPRQPLPEIGILLARIDELEGKEHTTQILRIEGVMPGEGAPAGSPEPTAKDQVTVFLEEAADLVDAAEIDVQHWAEAPAEPELPARIQRGFHAIKGGARMAGVTAIGDLAHALESLLESMAGRGAERETIDTVQAGIDRIAEMLNQVAQVATVQPALDLIATVDKLVSSAGERTAEPAPATEVDLTGEDHHPTLELPRDAVESMLEASAGDLQASGAEEYLSELADVFLEEAEEILDRAETTLEEWDNHPGQTGLVRELERQLHTLKGGARMADLSAVADLSHAVESLLKAVGSGRVDTGRELFVILHEAVDTLTGMVEQVRAGRAPAAAADLIHSIESIASGGLAVEVDEELTPPPSEGAEDGPPTMALAREEVDEFEPGEPAPADPTPPAPVAAPASGASGGMDITLPGEATELTAIFVEEAEELIESIETTLTHWSTNPANAGLVRTLERNLHTLKGGARMAGITAISDLSHAVESLLHAVADGRVEVSREMFNALHQAVDALSAMVESLRRQERPQGLPPLIGVIESLASGEDRTPESTIMEIPRELADQLAATAAVLSPEPEESPAGAPADEGPREAASAEPAPGAGDEKDGDWVVPSIEEITGEHGAKQADEEAQPEAADSGVEVDEDGGERRTTPRVQHETIRVRADLIDDLVNYAGEVGIYRSRLEQQSLTFRGNLTELEETVSRLNHQLRNLEIETEAQILYRYEKDREAGREKQEFDPLELDRFSTMQQLSRALAESVNDLNNLREMLGGLNRESETLLLQQSRVANVLQEGLMRSRMVQFGGLMPRMRRIVRQTCQEVGKWAKLRVEGAGVEMDTTVIDRILPALEHILRNAVAHGIEAPELRRSRGKDETGVIQLDLTRDGPDVVIRIADDGGGIDTAAIRRKAIDRGLIKPDVKLRDEDLAQLVLESGLSTAAKVTQVSGRGVGMDVVMSEVKQLGGSVGIESKIGRGAVFSLRIPFTLAINRALLVAAGETLYAIPLANVVGIARVTREELERFVSGEAKSFDYAGGTYAYRNLGALLTGQASRPHETDDRIPFLMVRAGDQYTALHIDGILGSRDVVVKSLGRQLSSVKGLYGATILADGRVVLILDIGALIHRGVLKEAAAGEPREAVKGTGKPVVMVVDDSITIRKVTSRLLERHEMESVTARDGLDALTVMEERVPDVMLLDIEMPRMDGYDLATHMRSDERLKGVPIIMITSRTGDKHRRRAMEIGVDRYLGKPYQEAELISVINEMLEQSAAGGG